MSQKAPGKAHREGISLMELTEMFPDEASAVKWFEDTRWPDGERHCGHCGSTETKEVPNAKPMPYWCKAAAPTSPSARAPCCRAPACRCASGRSRSIST